ncbi:MAG TPA: hypothetical protein QGH10_17900, partial [Armatimonadota bacterium]|nr:hypothetical protein [Armatimonadota bacterium]
MVGLIATLLCATPGPCQATWPIECDTSEGWEAKPDWVPNPSESATVRASNGVITFAVSEPGRGMKWTLPVRRLSAELPGYLLVRARSSGIVASGGYVLHTFDDDEGGAVIRPGDFPSDGQWHDIAVDLFHAGMRGAIEGIAVEVQARDGKAELSFDSLGPVAVPPPGATIVPGGARDDRAVTITFDEPLEFRPRYDWLGNPADEGDHLIEQADGHVKMTVTTPGRGMKWSTQLAEPIDLTGMAYVTIRYRAKGIATWGDYFVYAGSATGGAPPQTANLVRGTDIRADGRWHAETLRVEDLFPVKELAFQLQAGTPDAVAETSSLAFSTRRPLMNVADAFSYSEGWGESATASRSFTPVDLAGVVDTSGSDVARSFGLNDWLPAGRITAEGVPFELVEDRMALVPPGGGRVLEIPIGASARELILLMAARLPSEDLSGMLGGRPLRSFSQPERLRIGVERVDGSTDWMFPARVYDGAYQFSAGFDAYSLPELGDAPIANLHVRSAMTEATIGVLAVTANHAGPLTQPRPVAYLPPLAEPKHVKQTPPRLTVDGNSLTLGNAHLEARFDVGDGISLANLQHKNLAGGELRLAPGPIFSISVDDVTVRSTDVTVGEPTRNPSRAEASIAVPFDAQPAGLPFTGTLRVALGSGPDLAMSLDLRHVGDDTIRPG